MISALVPVKDLWQAKQRLASLLSPAERRAMCLVMLRDVLAALASARRLGDVLVYSADDEVLAVANDYHMAAVREPAGSGQSEAVTAAIPYCVSRGATSILTIPVDTPLLRGEDVDSLIDFAFAAVTSWQMPHRLRPSAVIVPSADGTGTNALLLTPPDALPPRFGPNSFARHVQEARERGVSYRALVLPRLGLDIDSPEDLAAFLQEAERLPLDTTLTYPHLLRSGIAVRCEARVL